MGTLRSPVEAAFGRRSNSRSETGINSWGLTRNETEGCEWPARA